MSGVGRSLVLAWYGHRPKREIDIELRATHLYFATFGDTSAAVRGATNEATINL